MQTDISMTVERHASVRIFDLPKSHDGVAITKPGRRALAAAWGEIAQLSARPRDGCTGPTTRRAPAVS
jgi:hypothetical protein